MAAQSGKQYELKEVVLRLAEGRSLYSDQAISNADAAVDVMRKELMQQDREVLCVVNLNAKMKPINFNIVSVGNLTQTVADIPFITKSAICSGAASTILLHTHPACCGSRETDRDQLRRPCDCRVRHRTHLQHEGTGHGGF